MELTEFEEGAINACRRYRMDDDYALEDFIEDLRKIMPPTCTKTERKFLDEVKERSWYVTNPALNLFCIEIRSKHSNVILHQSDFKSNLKELVE